MELGTGVILVGLLQDQLLPGDRDDLATLLPQDVTDRHHMALAIRRLHQRAGSQVTPHESRQLQDREIEPLQGLLGLVVCTDGPKLGCGVILGFYPLSLVNGTCDIIGLIAHLRICNIRKSARL